MSPPSPSSTAGLQVAHQQCNALEHKADVVTDGKHKIRNRIMDSIAQTSVINSWSESLQPMLSNFDECGEMMNLIRLIWKANMNR